MIEAKDQPMLSKCWCGEPQILMIVMDTKTDTCLGPAGFCTKCAKVEIY